VDASTSFGIEVVVDEFWESGELVLGWNTKGDNIGRAEMVAFELGLQCLVRWGFRKCHLHCSQTTWG